MTAKFHVPALCPNAHLFPSGYTMGAGVSDMTFVGNKQNCPVPGCGEMADVLDGTYETMVGPDGSLLVEAKALVPDQLRRMLEILETVESPAAAAELATIETDPQIKAILLGIANNRYTQMVVAALIQLLLNVLKGGG